MKTYQMIKRAEICILSIIMLIIFQGCGILSGSNPKVVQSVPSPGQTNVSKSQKIEVYFNKEIDLQKCIGAFSLQPYINGFFEYNDKVLTFSPSEEWQSGSTYIFSINQDCEDPDGRDLDDAYYASFAVGAEIEPPGLVSGQELMGDLSLCEARGNIEIVDFQTGVCYRKDGLRLKITFTEEMNTSATSSAFSIYPVVAGYFEWSGPTMTFIPTEDLKPNIQYRVSINTLAMDLNENNLSNEFIRYFSTGGDNENPAITNISSDFTTGSGGCNGGLEDSISNVNVNEVCLDNGGSGFGAVFRVDFSEQMDPGLTISAFSISPSVAGIITMLPGDTQLLFTSIEPLSPDTQYSISVNSIAKDINENALEKNYSYFFLTTNINGYPTANSIVLSAGSKANCDAGAAGSIDMLINAVNNACEGNPNVNDIIFTFSEPMNTTITESAISFSPNIPGSNNWNGTSTILTFTPDEKLIYGRRYTLSIATSAMDNQGQNIQDLVSREFVVIQVDVQNPQVTGIVFEQTNPPSADDCAGVPDDSTVGAGSYTTSICTSRPILINFDEPMDQSNTQNAVSFSPSEDISFIWNSDTQLQVNFFTSLQGSRDYTLTISTSAKDLAGNPLTSEFTLGFETEDTPNVIAIGLESHDTTCDDPSDIGGNSGWTAAGCWWKSPAGILDPSNYQLQGGNAACFTDTTTDNIRIVFNKPMNPVVTADAISVRRVSTPSSTIKIVGWSWDASFQVITLVIAESLATGCEGGSSNTFGGGDMDFEDGGAGVANYPFYLLEVDTTAEDAGGNRLPSTFSFAFEGE